MNGWTDERRAKQAKAIHQWRPWEQSSGPKSAEGKARVARSAFKGGRRQQMRSLARAFSELLRQEREQREHIEAAFGRV